MRRLVATARRIIWSAVQRERGRLLGRRRRSGERPTSDRLTVDAFATAVTASNQADGRRRDPSVVVHVDLDTLRGGRHDATLCETDSGVSVPVDAVRRMACDGSLVPVVLDGRGVVLDEGRSKRLATPEQRIAIQAMQATCSHPNCRVTVDECRFHRLRPWRCGGRTDLAELAPLCEAHHHLVHEGGWTFTMTAARVGTWIRPDGEMYWTGSLLDRRLEPASA